jgi:peptidoglycan hydrolase-like protein with peptidoglycan-binding domain
VTVVSVAGLVVTAWVGRPTPAALEPLSAPVYVPVEAWSDDQARQLRLSMRVRPPVDVLAPGLSGVVTSVWAMPGKTLLPGDRVYAVDGVAVFAYRGSGVLYRVLSEGDRGPDVRVLQRALAQALDLDLAVTGGFGPATREAVRQLQQRLGLPATGQAQPSWFVRIPAEATVGSVAVRLGAPAPAIGEPVLTTRATLVGFDVVGPDLEDGQYTVTANGVSVPASRMDGNWSTDQEADLLTLLPAAVDPASPATDAAAGGSRPSTSNSGTGQPDRKATVSVDVVVALAEPQPGVTVAPGALVGSVSGHGACVWRATDAGIEREVGLVITGTTPSGAAIVAGDALAGASVLLDPAAHLVEGEDVCP